MDYIIKADGTKTEVSPLNNKNYSLKEMKDIVGGYIEILHDLTTNQNVMVVNEEGKLEGLAFNKEGTRILRSWGYDDFVVGDVLLCSSDRIE